MRELERDRVIEFAGAVLVALAPFLFGLSIGATWAGAEIQAAGACGGVIEPTYCASLAFVEQVAQTSAFATLIAFGGRGALERGFPEAFESELAETAVAE